MEFLQSFQHRVHSTRSLSDKVGQLDDDDRGILMDRREEKFRIRPRFAKRLELQEILRLSAVQPEPTAPTA